MPGDILAFVPTMRDTKILFAILKDKVGDKILAVPLHAPRTPAEQKKATSRSQADGSVRKWVVATSVAEISRTIPDIVYIFGKSKPSGRIPQLE